MRALIIAAMLLLPSCAAMQDMALAVGDEQPALPEHCFPNEVLPPKEPKLEDRDNTDIDAVRDREAWKRAYRTEKANRATCAARLRVLFPDREVSKPTS